MALLANRLLLFSVNVVLGVLLDQVKHRSDSNSVKFIGRGFNQSLSSSLHNFTNYVVVNDIG
jgi:hypothetical protein